MYCAKCSETAVCSEKARNPRARLQRPVSLLSVSSLGHLVLLSSLFLTFHKERQ